MARARDYKAEYAKRQQRAQELYGVSYNQLRAIQKKAATAENENSRLKPDQVKTLLIRAKATGLNPRNTVTRLIEQKVEARKLKSQGIEVPPDYFDDFDALDVDDPKFFWYN